MYMLYRVEREKKEVCLDHGECGIIVVGNEFSFLFIRALALASRTLHI